MSRGTLQEITQYPAPECESLIEHERLEWLGLLCGRLMLNEIPGFVVRKNLFVEELTGEAIHTSLSEIVSDWADAEGLLLGRPARARKSGQLFNGLGQRPIGLLHFDASTDPRSGYRRSQPFIHTTLTGGGRVVLAEMGPDFGAACAALGLLRDSQYHPNQNLLDGQANPALINPTVYTALLEAGDSVVLKEKGTQPSWHRFDTDSLLGDRIVAASTLSLAA